jgi:hypothetical protein
MNRICVDIFGVQVNSSGAELSIRFNIVWPPSVRGIQDKLSVVSPRRTLIDILHEHHCHDVFMEDLQTLKDFDIVMICDDSGSMAYLAGPGKTRWEELKEVVKTVVEIACCLDDDGIELIFLNRPGMKNVSSAKQVKSLFKAGPSGGTPLTEAVNKAFAALADKPLLVLLATDGVPNNLASFTEALAKRDSSRIFVSILACSDNDSEIGYLNQLDDEIPNLDVLDDYISERNEVHKVKGAVDYTFGDHCARMLLGPVFPKYDNLDSMKF